MSAQPRRAAAAAAAPHNIAGRGANGPDKLCQYFHHWGSGRTNVRFMLNTNKWNTHITALRNYVARTGSSRVPRNYVEVTETGPIKLGAWVSYVRHRQRKGHLTTEQTAELSSLPNWQWGPLRAGRTSNPERDRLIIERFNNGKGETLQKIATDFNLTRQRVHQIVSASRSQS